MSIQRFTEGQTVSREMHLYAKPRRPYQSPDDPPWTYEIYTFGPKFHSPAEDVYIGKVQVSFAVPHGVDLLTCCVDNLRQKQDEIMGHARREVSQIEDQINSMLLLEHQPEPTPQSLNDG